MKYKISLFFLSVILGSLVGIAGAISTGTPFGWLFGLGYGAVSGLLLSPLIIRYAGDPNIFRRIFVTSIVLTPMACVVSKTLIVALAIPITGFLAVSLFRAWEKPKLFQFLAMTGLVVSLIVFWSPIFLKREIVTKETLIRDLGNDDMEIHLAAGQALMKLGLEPLRDALRVDDYSTRANAAHFIALLDDPKTIDVLKSLENDNNPHVRMWVAYGFGRHKTDESKIILKKLSGDKEAFVREKAIEALKK